MNLKDILNESQHLSYKRMNVGEEEEKGMTNEEKREFLKAVSEYKKFGESIYRSGNLAEVYESIKGIVETAHKVTLEETGDWFDKVTVNRHMKSMNESFKVFSNTIKEVNTLQQRLESCYDEMGEVLGKYYEIKEGNEFGAERAKAIAAGDDEFEVGGKKFPVKDVDAEDKENAKDFAKESVNEGKHDAILDKLADIVKGAKSFMDIGKELKSNGIKYSFGTNMITMYIIDKPVKIAILNNKYADGAERVVGDTAIGLMESIKEEKSMKLTDILSENKYSIIDPKGNQKGVGPKDAANKMQKKLGGSKKGYFVVPAKSALKARRAMEKYKFDFKNPKLQDMMSDLYFEGVEESVNEGKHDAILDKLADIVKDAKSFMDIGSGLKKAGIKYSFGTNMIPMYIIDKPAKIAILNNKYADGAERVVGTTAIGLMEGMVAEVTYDLGMARKGNGLTIYNKAEEEAGDYKNIAHVDNKGKIKFYDKKLPSKIKKQIEDEAKKMIESMNEGTKMIKLKNLLNESFGMGELPSSKLMKMKVSAKDMLDSVNPKKVNESSEEDVVEEVRASAKKLLQSVVKGETSRV